MTHLSGCRCCPWHSYLCVGVVLGILEFVFVVFDLELFLVEQLVLDSQQVLVVHRVTVETGMVQCMCIVEGGHYKDKLKNAKDNTYTEVRMPRTTPTPR